MGDAGEGLADHGAGVWRQQPLPMCRATKRFKSRGAGPDCQMSYLGEAAHVRTMFNMRSGESPGKNVSSRCVPCFVVLPGCVLPEGEVAVRDGDVNRRMS